MLDILGVELLVLNLLAVKLSVLDLPDAASSPVSFSSRASSTFTSTISSTCGMAFEPRVAAGLVDDPP